MEIIEVGVVGVGATFNEERERHSIRVVIGPAPIARDFHHELIPQVHLEVNRSVHVVVVRLHGGASDLPITEVWLVAKGRTVACIDDLRRDRHLVFEARRVYVPPVLELDVGEHGVAGDGCGRERKCGKGGVGAVWVVESAVGIVAIVKVVGVRIGVSIGHGHVHESAAAA